MIGRPSTSKPLRMLRIGRQGMFGMSHGDWSSSESLHCAARTHILPDAFSGATSSAEIRSGLYSLLHSMVAFIRFFPSAIFHLAARMYRAQHSGSSIHRRSFGW